MKTALRIFAVLVAVLFAAGCATTVPTTAPNNDLQQLQAAMDAKLASGLATKADKADVARMEQAVEKFDKKGDGAIYAIDDLNARTRKTNAAIAELAKKQATTDTVIVGLQKSQAATDTAVAELGKAVTTTNDRLDALEKRVVGIRKFTAAAVGRLGALEDSQGIDHDKKILRLSGFPSAKLNEKGELIACAEISKGMKARVDEIKKIVATGWKVVGVAGFADDHPFIKDGKVLNNSNALNAKCAEERAYAVDKAIGTDLGDSNINGRGTTTKFGGHDVNRSALVYLERVVQQRAPAAAPATKPAPAQPAAPVAPAQPAPAAKPAP